MSSAVMEVIAGPAGLKPRLSNATLATPASAGHTRGSGRKPDTAPHCHPEVRWHGHNEYDHRTWSVEGVKDRQLVRPDWSPAEPVAIEGVTAKQITSVLTDNGYLTEMWRPEWNLDQLGVGKVFQRVIDPGSASGWHAPGAPPIDSSAPAVGCCSLCTTDASSLRATGRWPRSGWDRNDPASYQSLRAFGTAYGISDHSRW